MTPEASASDVDRLYRAIERLHARVDELGKEVGMLNIQLARCSPVQHEQRLVKAEAIFPRVRQLEKWRLRLAVISTAEVVAIIIIASQLYQLFSR